MEEEEEKKEIKKKSFAIQSSVAFKPNPPQELT